MQLSEQLAVSTAPRLSVRLARSDKDIRRAQKLRYQVFATEMGAQLASAAYGDDLAITGHSLGGGLAATAAMAG